MTTGMMTAIAPAIEALLTEVVSWYKDLHEHPELSGQETRTAGIAAAHLRSLGFAVSVGVGGTGVVGILRNGPGRTVMVRADMDALPIREKTGLPYASHVTATLDGETVPVSHMCGHDAHVACLMGAARLLAEHRDVWQGTLMVVFQPGEEDGTGASGMIRDMGPLDKADAAFPRPDVVLGQHVTAGPAGSVAWCKGPILAAADSLQVVFKGRGTHGSTPHNGIDPVILAAYAAVRLQSVVSREIPPLETAVLTIGSIQAGNKENIVPDHAIMKLNMRSYKDSVRNHLLEAVRRICESESLASGAPEPPDITPISSFPVTVNDEAATDTLLDSFGPWFGDRLREMQPRTGSEDFGFFGRAWGVPSVFWYIGSTDRELWDEAVNQGRITDVPSNHSPRFAPSPEPTLRTGVETLVLAALTWLGRP